MAEPTDLRQGVFDRIRAACALVAGEGRHVRVLEDQIPRLAEAIWKELPPAPIYDEVHHFRGDDRSTLAYIITLDAVNFGSGYFPYLTKRRGTSGYYTVATSLADRFRANGPLSAETLSAIKPQACANIFGQDTSSEPVAELMRLFAQAWNDLGRDLLDRFEGRFENLLISADHFAGRLVDLLDAQPLFHDVATYNGFAVPFYKRAQIAASDLALAFDGEGLGHFEDIDRLTIFADNLVPHVLRMLGLLEYDSELLARIERSEEIESGSEEEVEIRACALHAVGLLSRHLKDSKHLASERALDIALWTQGQSPEIKAEPRHRTRSTFY